MRLPYRGFIVEIDKEKWRALSIKGKTECVASYFSEQGKYLMQKQKDYWFGWVEVRVQTIGNTGKTPDPIYEVTIYAGRRGDGQTFGKISRDLCEEIVNQLTDSQKKYFELLLVDGCFSQRYTFNRYQKRLLVESLKPLLSQEWYEEET